MQLPLPHLLLSAMKSRLFLTALLATALAGRLHAAEEEPAPERKKGSEPWRAQMLEDAKKQAAKPAPKSAPAPAKATTAAAPASGTTATPATPTTEQPAAANTTAAAKTPAPAGADAATAAAKPNSTTGTEPKKDTDPALLPKVEVNRSKPTELGRMMYETEKEIVREKQLTKSSELDKALNNSKVSLPVFGGQTTSSRESIAAERVSLMEAEKDLIEEIAHAKTKADKQKLEKELLEIKKIRRELEHSIR